MRLFCLLGRLIFLIIFLLESKPFTKSILGIRLEMSLNEWTDDDKIIISLKSKLNILLNSNILNILLTILEGMIFFATSYLEN
jgi:hypothetical protein